MQSVSNGKRRGAIIIVSGYYYRKQECWRESQHSFLVERMNKSCQYCGGIHPQGFICDKKPQRNKKNTISVRFRNSRAWKKKAEEIKKRDSYLCQCCIRQINNTSKMYNYKDLQVHHAIPIVIDYDKRLDNNNLLTLCPHHHKLAETKVITYKQIKQIIDEQEIKYESISPPSVSCLK